MASRGNCAVMALLALMTGCSEDLSEPSKWYTTSSIYAYMKATQTESGEVTTTVELRNGNTSGATYLYLSDGETLYSALDKSPGSFFNYTEELFANSLAVSQDLKIMASRSLYTNYVLYDEIAYGKPEYFSAESPDSGVSPTRSYVAFERAGQVWAGESSIDIPPAFQIQSPAAFSTLSRATPVVLGWSNTDPATSMELVVVGDCEEGTRYILYPALSISTDPDGTSSVTLSSSDYFDSSRVAASVTCQVAFLLKRVRTGPVSSNFAFGTFKGIQQRTVRFTSIP